ncbi:hypothetical protein JAAARDRAFT_180037 [Jaapia argillacea MUCL 33604]|uniref:DNA-directed RNA polymerase I subunit RPA49 n=1 Tax=Jaapia argillacea MUCL 33604 TaxID=933084 RepID=A0A067PLV8_9AGAM|nr:hypothetical protein JAAARDRAFT_180037 [Jaapia argillacea MUCL 33604]
MTSTATSKKRKRDVVEKDDSGKISFQLASQPASQLGPVLASFPALQPPLKTAFRCYSTQKRRKSDDEEQEFASRQLLVAGEADTVEFFGNNEAESGSMGCRYMVGVYNKRTNSIVIRPAPLHILTRQVKALKGIEPAAVTSAQRLEARHALGETFGTKKAKAAIRAHERNKVDVSAMEKVAGHLQDRIESNTGNLPTLEEAKSKADSTRLIPPYDAEASLPTDVYALHDIIPEPEWNGLSVSALTHSERDRTALLPFSRSKWVNQHLALLFSAPKVNKSDLKILFYISTMLAFRQVTSRSVDKQKVQDRLKSVPSIVVEGLLSRFTETVRGSSEARTTTASQTSLLTHMFALCLRIDDFATDTSLLAGDLSMEVAKVNQLFKSLGCKIDKLSMTELNRLGLPDSAAQTKRAVLRVPLEFPKPRARRRN